MIFFYRMRINNKKIYMGPSKTQNCHSNPKGEKKAEGIPLTDFRQYYKTTVIKTEWFWYKNRHTDQ